VESDISTASTNVTSGSKSSLESKASNPARKRGGSSNEGTRELSKCIEQVTREAVHELYEMKSKNTTNKARLKQDSLKEIIS
jgi:hypothetical protein